MAGVFLSGTAPRVVSGICCSACHLVFLSCLFLLSILCTLCYWPSHWSLLLSAYHLVFLSCPFSPSCPSSTIGPVTACFPECFSVCLCVFFVVCVCRFLLLQGLIVFQWGGGRQNVSFSCITTGVPCLFFEVTRLLVDTMCKTLPYSTDISSYVIL